MRLIEKDRPKTMGNIGKAMVEFSIVERTGKPMETPSKNRKMVSYIDTPFFDLFFAEEMASFSMGPQSFWETEKIGKFSSIFRCKTQRRREAAASEPEPPIRPAQCPGSGTITRSFSNSAMPGERLFVPKCL